MLHSQFDPAARQALAIAAVESKTRKDLSWQQVADASGLSVAFTTAAVLGQHPLPEAAAKAVSELLDLDEDAAMLLQAVPTRGSIPGGIPTDPTIYRFYEMLQVYGTTLKALVHEEFGGHHLRDQLQARRQEGCRSRRRRACCHHPGRQVPADQAFLVSSAPAASRRTAGRAEGILRPALPHVKVSASDRASTPITSRRAWVCVPCGRHRALPFQPAGPGAGWGGRVRSRRPGPGPA